MDPTDAGAVASSSRLPPPSEAPPVEPLKDQKNVIISNKEVIPTQTGPDGIKIVPAQFECCEPSDLVELIGGMLNRLIAHNDRLPLPPDALTRFHSRAPPPIPLIDYLHRITKYTNLEPAVLMILLPYVDSVCARNAQFTISSLTVHRFLIAAVSVGSKALSDRFCTNGRYARVGGVSLGEMGLLEKEFCEAIDWRLTTTGKVLSHYYTSLVQAHPGYRLASPFLPTPQPAHPPPPAQLTPSPNVAMVAASSPPIRAYSPGPQPSTHPQHLQTQERGRSAAPAPVGQIYATGPPPHTLAELASHPTNPPVPHQPTPVHPTDQAAHQHPPGSMTSTRTASPALIPAPGSRRGAATASHLPSPVRAAPAGPDPDPAGWVGLVTRSLSGVAAERSVRARQRGGSGSTTGSRGAGTATTATGGETGQSSPASSLASSAASGGSPPMPMVVVDEVAGGVRGVASVSPHGRVLLSPGKRGASREHSADGGREGRRTRSPVVGPGRG